MGFGHGPQVAFTVGHFDVDEALAAGACWLQELEAYPGVEIPALRESLDDVRRGLGEWTVMVAREPSSGRLVGAVRGRLDEHGEWDIGRVMVAPDLQGRGLGRGLLELVEGLAPAGVATYVLFTGARSTANKYGLDIYWRNVRTHTVHDPVSYRLREIGEFALNQTLPKPRVFTPPAKA